jgi:hypothetical protein
MVVHVNIYIYQMHEHVLYNYLEIWILFMASKYLWVNGSARRLDHFIPKFTNNIQDLMVVPVDYLYEPPND